MVMKVSALLSSRSRSESRSKVVFREDKYRSVEN